MVANNIKAIINKLIILALFGFVDYGCCVPNCLNLDVSITQRIKNAGFHREINWLIETSSPDKHKWLSTNCQLCLMQHILAGMYVNPDEVAELNRTGVLTVHLEGRVDVELPAHEATEHTIFIYLDNKSIARALINLPVHLRYQRAQITGGFGKIPFQKPSLLAYCPEGLMKICAKGLKVEAPCNVTAEKICIWTNVTYQALFDDTELLVPVGNLDDHPLVSIVTLLLSCAGCIYILSILKTTPL